MALVRKVIELERKKGLTDTAAVGGLEALVRRHLPAAAKTIAGYSQMTATERARALERLEAQLQKILQGETALRLDSPISAAPGVGEKRAHLFRKLGIHTVEDLLTFFPRRLEDRTQLRPIKDLRDGENALVEGVLRAKSKVKVKPNLELVKAALDDGTGILFGIWFNQPWIWEQLEQGQRYAFYGKVQIRFGEIQMENPVWEKAGTRSQTGRFVPIYPSTEGLSQNILQHVIRRTLARVGPIPETIPEEIRAKYKLLSRRAALQKIHFPESLEEFEKARETLAFEELFLLQLGLVLHRKRETQGRVITSDPQWLKTFVESLPFSLTPSQRRAIAHIEEDLRAPYPMLRLLQGDVGSGKTVVAAAACVMVASAGAQAAVMAPTEILAEQHFFVFQELLRPLPIKIGLLSGGLSKKEREEMLAAIAKGEIQVVVGTHALLEEDVEFRDLALAVIDEQHRFGVIQRATLEKKGRGTNVLVMSATPIPRTVVLTVYGEFELSVLEELPIPRRNVRTVWVAEAKRPEVYEEVARRLAKGEKGYVVFPLVEESEELDLRAATVAYEELRARFGALVGLLHGRMSSEEKRAAMAAFREGRTRLLVATTVVELGLDVPDASFLVIEHADRFGLAQLHQLRGRIGRQGQEAICWALADPSTPEARERLTAFRDLTDGFKIAEADLRIRGPGDLLGTAQHGFISKFRAADLVRDLGLLERARIEARKLAEKGVPPELVAEVERRFGKDLELLGV